MKTVGMIARKACSYSDECHYQNYEGPNALSCPGCADIAKAIQDEMDNTRDAWDHERIASEHYTSVNAELKALKERIEAKAVTWDVVADAESAPAYMRQAARDNAAGCRALLEPKS